MKSLFILSLFSLLLFLYGCSSSKKFSDEEYRNIEFNDNSSIIRVLVDEQKNMYNWSSDVPVYLKNGGKTVGLIQPGVTLQFVASGNSTNVKINGQSFTSSYFQIIPDEGKRVQVKSKNYRGSLRISSNSGKILVINTLKLEEYLRGVIPAEMPAGKGTENYEALKAFAICARTYAFMHLSSTGNYDIYNDVRDQVYSGTDGEKSITNKAILETKGYLLTYRDKPAVIYYHSTCGGFTEDASNVFSTKNTPYLQSIKDGEPSNCSISPKYQWKEIYSNLDFVSRFRTAGLINGPNWSVKNVEIKSRFPSGRVKELAVTFSDSEKVKDVVINGNNIRNVLRNSSNSSILNSTLFEISLTEEKGIIISGRGYGHGVGLCQFGAINMARNGRSYLDILEHYFPGTKTTKYYD